MNNETTNYLKIKILKNNVTQILIVINIISCTSLIKILEILGKYNKVYNIQKIFLTHCIFITIGFGIVYFLSQLHQQYMKRIIVLMFIFFIILLILTLIISPSINGTNRWLFLLGFSIQPSFFFLSTYSYINSNLLFKEKYFKSLALLISILLLFMLQPDFGSSLLLLGIWGVQLFFFNQLNKFKKYFIIIGSMFPVFFLFKGIYALKRIQFIFKPNDEINQMNIALKAIKSSKLFLNNRYIYIPEMHNDYFFSAFTNVYGILPSIGLLILFFSFLYNLLETLKYNDNILHQGVILGSTCFIGGQWALHTFTNLNLIPAKGISLPFISAGGSLILSNFITIGIIFCLLQNNKK